MTDGLPGIGPLPAQVDLVVIGAGLMGAMTAWAASRRGLGVLCLEQTTPGNGQGSSHGSARIVRRAYPDELYVELTGRAFDRWTELEADADVVLLRMTGGLDHGGARDVRQIAAVLDRQRVPHRLMSAAAAESRWPGMRFDTEVLYHEQAGTVDAERAVAAALRVMQQRGGLLATHTRVTSVRPLGEAALVQTTAGEVRADRVVVAAGAWLPPLLADCPGLGLDLPPLRVTQQQIFHFPRADGIPEWPTSVHKGAISTYSLAGGRDGGRGGARKVAEHDAPGYDTSAAGRSGVVDPAARARIVSYVRDWLPGLVPEPLAETTCLYTCTANEDFLLDRVGPVVICSPCSGHGAKFAPLIGELAVQLATGASGPLPRFALAAHR